MLPVLQFIFSDFWHWLGSVILIGTAGTAVGQVIAALSRR